MVLFAKVVEDKKTCRSKKTRVLSDRNSVTYKQHSEAGQLNTLFGTNEEASDDTSTDEDAAGDWVVLSANRVKRGTDEMCDEFCLSNSKAHTSTTADLFDTAAAVNASTGDENTKTFHSALLQS
eukprot:scaffold7309_cov153-Skeletonema_marinoi.AAC.4